ncbi:hypothetical protein [Streptomyces wuyuanensis]|uniref:hypothetical protein n=1 Tax=Streptomyces wuyuanensis TaxID=1196353 RepID=UPI0037176FD5
MKYSNHGDHCQTVSDVSSGERASTVVLQVVDWKGDIWGGGSMLASYEDGKASRSSPG